MHRPRLPAEGPLPYPGSPACAGPVTPQPPVPTSSNGSEHAAIERLLDANLDRAREGLRVLEDWARFALDRPDLVARSKDLRQRLGRLHQTRYKLARHTATDSAAGMAHPAQAERQDGASVLAANAGRVQEALRVLEEFGRLEDPRLAAEAAAIRYALYDLEVDLLQAGRGGDQRRALLRRCHLYLVTSPVEGLELVVAAALAAGVRLVQYRAKPGDGPTPAGAALDDRSRFAQASALRQLCHRHGALFLVNDRIDLALAVGADGVHLGQGDLPPAVARRLLGPDRLIGRSTHRLEDLRQAVADGCDYVGVGPVNATPTKPGREPVGLAYVSQAAAECPLPFYAIGGIDRANLAVVRQAGAERVAVVRAITQAGDPGAAAAALLAGLEALA
ncbi:thiamine phosphate synthase [Cyanobium sp. Cruz-8D1]|nr:thiamine phosphate synthase [Cyanobium sp. Cruz-8H5]MCP9864754.1 thiamine phosphate synthase [Cyanobium sp. Cruz-8D1]